MKLTSIVLTAGLLCFGTALSAQAPAPAPEVTKSVVMHDVEIIGVSGNVITFEEAGVVKQWTAPEGFLFNVDGKEVPASGLHPGTKVTTLVYTKTTTIPASKVVSYKSAKVTKIQGTNVIVELESGKYQSIKVKKDAKFMVGGKEVILADMRPGMIVTQKIVTETTPQVVTQKAMVSAGTTPAPKAEPAPAPAPEPAPAAKKLPKTGSNLPLVGLFGALLLAIGAGLTLRRTF